MSLAILLSALPTNAQDQQTGTAGGNGGTPFTINCPNGKAMIGLGGSIASALPWLLSNLMGVSRESENGNIPDSVKFAFYIGGTIFLLAVLYTIFTTKEYHSSISKSTR